jgi:hypothetical protein
MKETIKEIMEQIEWYLKFYKVKWNLYSNIEYILEQYLLPKEEAGCKHWVSNKGICWYCIEESKEAPVVKNKIERMKRGEDMHTIDLVNKINEIILTLNNL